MKSCKGLYGATARIEPSDIACRDACDSEAANLISTRTNVAVTTLEATPHRLPHKLPWVILLAISLVCGLPRALSWRPVNALDSPNGLLLFGMSLVTTNFSFVAEAFWVSSLVFNLGCS